MTTAVANAGGENQPVANSQGATAAHANASETNVGNQPPVVNNAPPAQQQPAKTAEQLAAEAAAAEQAKPKQTQEQEAAAAEAARVAGLDIDFVQGSPAEVATVNAAIQLMKDAGLKRGDANKIFGRAFETGNLADINRAELVAKVGEQKAALILAGIGEYNNSVGSNRQATVKAVWGVMDGEQNWKTVRAWAKAKEATDTAFGAELDEYRRMIDAGGKSAEFAAKELRKMYESDPKNSSLGRAIVQGDGTVTRVENPITDRAEYVRELKKAHAKGDMDAVRSIEQRRAAGRQMAARR